MLTWKKAGDPPNMIAQRLGRDLSTVVRQLGKSKESTREGVKVRGCGRPPALTAETIDRLVDKTEKLTKAAYARFQITVGAIKKAAGLNCCEKVVLQALHSRGMFMRPLRQKPVRTRSDDEARLAFAKKYQKRPATYWSTQVDGFLDNKFFPVYTNGAARAYAAKRVARGNSARKATGWAVGTSSPKRT